MVDYAKENTKIQSLVDSILTSVKEKHIITATQKLIKYIEPKTHITFIFDMNGLFNKINTVTAKQSYIDLACELHHKISIEINPLIIDKVINHILTLHSEHTAYKLSSLCKITSEFHKVTQDHNYKVIEFLYFDCLIISDHFSIKILEYFYNLFYYSSIKNDMIELIIDTCVIIAMSIHNNPEKITIHLPYFFKIFDYYITKVNLHKTSVLRNIISVISFYNAKFNHTQKKPKKKEPWSFMLTCFQKEQNKVIRILLDNIVSYSSMSYKYTGVEVFEFMDEQTTNTLKMNFIITSNRELKYITFIEKEKNTLALFQREKVSICKGIILFIGWGLLGYKKVKTEVSKAVILKQFLKIIKEIKGISFEVISCVARIVEKWGYTLHVEWNDIFEIIDYVYSNESEWKTEQLNQGLLMEIVDNLNKLLINRKYYGNKAQASNLIQNMKPSESTINTNLTIRYQLLSSRNIGSNLQSIINEYLVNEKPNHIKIFTMEMIRFIYTFPSSGTEQNSNRTKMIEEYTLKYFNQIMNTFEGNQTNLAYFSYLLSTILKRMTDKVLFVKYIAALICYKHEKEKSDLIRKFKFDTFLSVFDSLNRTLQVEKMKAFIKMFFKEGIYAKDSNMKDAINPKDNINSKEAKECILKFSMRLIAESLVNCNHEMVLSHTNKCQLLSLNYYNELLSDKKKTLLDHQAYVTFKNYLYQPHIKINYDNLFKYLISKLNDSSAGNAMYEEILSLYAIALKKIFYLSGEKMLYNLLYQVISVNNFAEYSNTINNKIVFLLEEIIVNSAYHLITDLFPNQPYQNGNEANTSIININKTETKLQCIHCLFTSYKAFAKNIDDIIFKYKSYTQMETFGQLTSIRNKPPTEIDSMELKNNDNNGSMKFLLTFEYLIKTVISLHFSLTSITPFNAYSLKQEEDPVNFNFPEAIYEPNNSTMKNYLFEKSKLNLIEMIEHFRVYLWLGDYKQSYNITVLHFLIGIKELMYLYGDLMTIKVLYIALAIGYPDDLEVINNAFYSYFGHKIDYTPKSSYDNQIIKTDKGILKYTFFKQDFVCQLANIVIIYYLSKVKVSNSIWNVIHFLFTDKKRLRDTVMYDYFNWRLTIKGVRDELNSNHRSIIYQNTQIYYGNHNIIMTTPVDDHSYDVIVRNRLCNISININAEFENNFHIDNSFNVISKVINISNDSNNPTKPTKQKHISLNPYKNNMKYDLKLSKMKFGRYKKRSKSHKMFKIQQFLSDKTSNEIINSNVIIQHLINLSCSSYDTFTQLPHNTFIAEKIAILDSIPLYKTYHCGIIYYPYLYNISSYDVMGYSKSVSSEYLNFITSLGCLYDIGRNPQISLGVMNNDGSDGSHVICYKDPIYNIVFQVSNLLFPSIITSTSQLISVRERIFSSNHINLIWMENPLQEFNINLLLTKTPKVFIIIHPLSTTHFLIKRRENKEMKKHKEILNTLFIHDYVINIKTKCGIDYFIQNIISISRVLNDLFSSPQVKETCLLDNLIQRHEVIETIQEHIKQNYK